MQMQGSNYYSVKCFYCGQQCIQQTHIKCKQCATATYCSVEHQSFHWVAHQMQCGISDGMINQYSGYLPPGNMVGDQQHVAMDAGIQQLTVAMNTNIKQPVAMDTSLRKQPDGGEARMPPAPTLALASHLSYPLYEAPQGISKEQILKEHAQYITMSLNNDGYCVIDGLLGNKKVDAIATEMTQLLDQGLMVQGQVVQQMQGGRLRGDKVAWVSGEEQTCTNIKLFMNVVDHLITYCGGKFHNKTIKGRTQAMAACYMGDGVGYRYHIDNPHHDGRCITSLYYLNKDWDAQRDGGTLRLHPYQNQSSVIVDPIADRLLFFWSDERSPHEVLPPFRKRFAITLWYFDAKEREEVRSKYFDNLKNNFAMPTNSVAST